jgi:hypothetical protein
MANIVPQERHTFWRSGISSRESPQQWRLLLDVRTIPWHK